jgi:hypothetical protein
MGRENRNTPAQLPAESVWLFRSISRRLTAECPDLREGQGFFSRAAPYGRLYRFATELAAGF